jgi:hypothetical protein
LQNHSHVSKWLDTSTPFFAAELRYKNVYCLCIVCALFVHCLCIVCALFVHCLCMFTNTFLMCCYSE